MISLFVVDIVIGVALDPELFIGETLSVLTVATDIKTLMISAIDTIENF